MRLKCDQIARAVLGDPHKRVGKELLYSCPNHHDEHPSLNINPEKNVFLCGPCAAGGGPWKFASFLARLDPGEKAAVAAWLHARDLLASARNANIITVLDLAKEKQLPVEFLAGLGLENVPQGVKIQYRTLDGSPAPRQMVRTALAAREGSKWDEGKGQIVPYGLWRIPEARKAGYVIMVEGESDPWTLWFHGYPALGIPGAHMSMTLMAEHIEGILKVFILQETDAAGINFVRSVIGRLKEFGWTGKAEVVSLAPMDVSDLHCADPATFRDRFESALKDAQTSAGGTLLQAASGFTLTPLGDLLEKPDEPVDYVWDDLLVVGTVSALVAKPKVGKGTLERNLALAVARGEDFLGHPTLKGECLYLALEEREEEIKQDFRAMGADGTELIFVHAAPSPPEGIRALCDLVHNRRPRLVVIDPIVRLARIKDETAYAETYAALGPLIDVARETGAHLLLLHHSGKSLKADPIDSPLGSTAIAGAVSTLIVLKRTEAYRTIQTRQRTGLDVPETILQFDPETKRLDIGGCHSDAERQQCETRIIEFLEGTPSPRPKHRFERQ